MDSVSAFGGTLARGLPPEDQVCAVRAMVRHRQQLVEMAAQHIQHMAKGHDLMNLQLQHVLSELPHYRPGDCGCHCRWTAGPQRVVQAPGSARESRLGRDREILVRQTGARSIYLPWDNPVNSTFYQEQIVIVKPISNGCCKSSPPVSIPSRPLAA